MIVGERLGTEILFPKAGKLNAPWKVGEQAVFPEGFPGGGEGTDGWQGVLCPAIAMRSSSRLTIGADNITTTTPTPPPPPSTLHRF